MNSEYDYLIDLLNGMLGKSRKHNEGTGQISYDCPVCSYDIKGLERGDGKGNLEVNYYRNLYHCWSCGETNDTHGHLEQLIKTYGTKEDLRTYNLLRSDKKEVVQKTYRKPKLPKEFVKFSDLHDRLPIKRQALKYLKERGVTDQMIKEFNLGVATGGSYVNRIIIPSYDENKELNYFVARSFVGDKLKYKNPTYPKEEIIFNESKINWFNPIWIVEGPFDSLFIPNSIPILGKVLSDKLWNLLYNKATSVVICLDEDAWDNSKMMYNVLNGGKLEGKVRIVHLPKNKDLADIRGQVPEECWVDPDKLWKN
jgi:DNA primase